MLIFIIGIFILFGDPSLIKGYTETDSEVEKAFIFMLSRVVGVGFTAVGSMIFKERMNEIFSDMLGRGVQLTIIICIIILLIIILVNTFIIINLKRKATNDYDKQYVHVLKILPVFVISIAFFFIISQNLFLVISNNDEINKENITTELPKSILDITSEDKYKLNSNHMELSLHLDFGENSLNAPILGNDIYFCSDNEVFIQIGGSEGNIKKVIKYKSMSGRLDHWFNGLLYKDKYYIYHTSGIFEGDDRINVLDIKTGKVVYKIDVKKSKSYIFEIYENYLIYSIKGINIYALDLEKKENITLFELMSPRDLNGKRMFHLGSDTIILNENIYLTLEEHGDFIIDLKEFKVTKTKIRMKQLLEENYKSVLEDESISFRTKKTLFHSILGNKDMLSIKDDILIARERIKLENKNEKYKLSVMNSEDLLIKWEKEYMNQWIDAIDLPNYYLILTEDGIFELLDKSNGELISEYKLEGLDGYDINLLTDYQNVILATRNGDFIVLKERK